MSALVANVYILTKCDSPLATVVYPSSSFVLTKVHNKSGIYACMFSIQLTELSREYM